MQYFAWGNGRTTGRGQGPSCLRFEPQLVVFPLLLLMIPVCLKYPSPFSYPHDIAMNIVGRAESRSQ